MQHSRGGENADLRIYACKSLDFFIFDDTRRKLLRLLDSEVNPKISYFGLARTFGEQYEGSTKRVVGTYGYVALKYAIYGQFSIKSDVFSFGVLLLEMISEKKNRGFNHLKPSLNLVGHAWILRKEGNPLELID
ncbi:hypothetical protein SLA2020_081520 [Shorea laevis]